MPDLSERKVAALRSALNLKDVLEIIYELEKPDIGGIRDEWFPLHADDSPEYQAIQKYLGERWPYGLVLATESRKLMEALRLIAAGGGVNMAGFHLTRAIGAMWPSLSLLTDPIREELLDRIQRKLAAKKAGA
jgi:hypothetical protein